MWRRLLLLTVTVALATGLSGCATTYEYYGDERYHEPAGGVVYDSYPDDGGYAYSGSSAYYDAGYGYYADPDWYAYPAYYSMFWSLNRWYVDPFWHPSFYYGVTFFPRHYFAVSFRSWPRYSGHYWWPPYYRYVPYAPYRGAWFDYYYDWTPWYAHHPHIRHHYAPRYGNVRHETERLTNWSRRGNSYEQWRLEDRNISFQREPEPRRDVRDRTEYYRGATTADRNARRADPDVRGFSGGQGARSNRPSTSARTDPGVRGFNAPAPDREASRSTLPTKPYGETRGASSGTARGTGRGGVDRSDADRSVPIVRRDPPSNQTRTTQRSNTDGGERYTTIRSYERSSGSSRGSYSGSEDGNSRPLPSTRRESSSDRWSVPAPSSRPSESRTAAPSYRQPTEPRGYTPRSLERPAEPNRSYSAPTRSYAAPAPASRDYSRPSRPEPAARPQFETRAPAERPQPQRAEPRQDRGGREARSDEDDGGRERGRR